MSANLSLSVYVLCHAYFCVYVHYNIVRVFVRARNHPTDMVLASESGMGKLPWSSSGAEASDINDCNNARPMCSEGASAMMSCTKYYFLPSIECLQTCTPFWSRWPRPRAGADLCMSVCVSVRMDEVMRVVACLVSGLILNALMIQKLSTSAQCQDSPFCLGQLHA